MLLLLPVLLLLLSPACAPVCSLLPLVSTDLSMSASSSSTANLLLLLLQ
jgi:hypothetical protein